MAGTGSGRGNWRGRPDKDWSRPTIPQLRVIEAKYRPAELRAPPKSTVKPLLIQAIKGYIDASANPPSDDILDRDFGLQDRPRAPDLPGANGPPEKQAPHAPGKQVPPLPGKQIPLAGKQVPPLAGKQVPLAGKQVPPPPGKQVPPPPGNHAVALLRAVPVSIQQNLQDLCRSAWANASQDALQLNATTAFQTSRRGRAGANFDTSAGLEAAGRYFPHRGRGPTWKRNSCAVDSSIVAAMFMNVGSTAIDMGPPGSPNSVPNIQRRFLEMVRENWDFILDTVDHKNAFISSLLQVTNEGIPIASHKSLGDELAATAIWNACASDFRQFNYGQAWFTNCGVCGGQGRAPVEERTGRVALDSWPSGSANKTPTMQQLLVRQFAGQPRTCTFGCEGRPRNAQRRRIIYGALPPRLVVEAAANYRNIPGATRDDISFTYQDTTGTEHNVTYRWLGGVYNNRGRERGREEPVPMHYRTYWTDHDYPDTRGPIKIYDGLVRDGSIIGGIAPASLDAKVPASWADGTDILFYERVHTPDLNAALDQARTVFTSSWTELDSFTGSSSNTQQTGLPSPTATPGNAGGPVTPAGPTSNPSQQPTGLDTPTTTPSKTGVAGPSTRSNTLKRGPPGEEEEESRKRQQLDPEADPLNVSPTQRPRETLRTSPKESKSPKKASRSPKGKGKAVSPPKFTSPTYKGETRSTRSTVTPPSPKAQRKSPLPPKKKRITPPSQGTKRRASSGSSPSKSPGATKRLRKG